ncbi:MAG: amino acid-binding protein [Halobacteriota archaeon]|nr:amino acid-binding protein [Halobacteriota archaeon]
MLVSMDLELMDIPGQLALALKPISEFGGNIKSVIHHHEKMTPRKTIPVQITIEIGESRLHGLIDEFKEAGVIVARVGEERLRESTLVMLIGHILNSDIKDTIDTIDNTGFAEVVDLSLSMPGIDERSSASLVINAVGEDELKNAMELLRDVSKEKDLLMVTPISL